MHQTKMCKYCCCICGQASNVTLQQAVAIAPQTLAAIAPYLVSEHLVVLAVDCIDHNAGLAELTEYLH